MKFCRKCQLEKPLTCWTKHGSTADRLQAYCNDCRNQQRREARKQKLGCYATEYADNRDEHLLRCRKLYYRYKEQVFSHYCNGTEYSCKHCGFTDMRALSVDHMAGDGADHRRGGTGSSLYKWLVHHNFPEGFQVLCMNCQWIKRYDELGFSVV